ncbi:protein-L-isoaspartate O-methyltransferase [Thelephora terrestris]|uniref:protein-L-isoaspartate(D-aspartate) O-methyltransferase n=1 Tax=Thelephora terrestris TaxID=56493 RepID=A0A9P6L8S6_9AGAM|nr:protein-L-isoaspartate O-methyltransferase [Thelephora terrestris]
MAWRCSGLTNVELIENMSKNGLIKSARVRNAMKKVDRANYVLDKREAYEDAPQRIGHGATISAPHMHAHASEYLLTYLQPGSKVLDVGSGSGYLTAIFHHLVSPGDGQPAGKVVGIDHISELVDWSVENLKKDGLGPALESSQIEMVVGDGRKGHVAAGPYNCIHVGAAAPTIPQELIDQLAQPGRLFIPVGTGVQEIIQIDKDDSGRINQKRLFGVTYVPLTDQDKQRRSPH